MRLIPVIDLMRGQAVRAVRGERSTYQPLRSRLCVGAEPVAVARAMLAHRLDDLVAISFTPALAFDQTPGPQAGAALLPGRT